MATRRILKHASDSVSSNKLVTLNIPSFETICQMGITFTNSGAAATLANIKSSVSNITVLINGEQIVNLSASALEAVWKALGTQVGTSTLVNSLPLMLPQLLYKLPEAEGAFDLGCEKFFQNTPITNIQIQIQFGTVTSITDVQAYTERVNKGTGKNVTVAVAKLLSYFQGFTTTGTSEVDTLPRDSNMGRLFTLAIPDATGVISSGEALVNNDPVIQNADKATNDMFVAERGFGPVSGIYNYSFTDGGTADLLSMLGVTDFRVKTTFSTANTAGYTLIDATVRTV